MRFRFTGKYTNGRTTVSIYGATFEGYDPIDVADDDVALNLLSHPEVEEVAPLDHDGDGNLGGSLPKARRGRPRR